MDDISRTTPPGSGPVPALSRSRAKGPTEIERFSDMTIDESELGDAEPPGRSAGGDAEDARDSEGAGEDSSPADEPPAAEVPGADEDSDATPPLTDPGELARVILAVLLSTREAMTAMRLAEICNSTQKAVQAGIDRLEQDLGAARFPLELCRSGDGLRLLTAPAVFPYLLRQRKLKKADKLSPAALETLAVIAYRQPAFRAEIEAIRGVKAGPLLRNLLDHKLIKVVGRADVPGRPLQYGTTQRFLERFGLRSIKDLPSIQEFRALA